MFETPTCSQVQQQFSCNLKNLSYSCDLVFSFFVNLHFSSGNLVLLVTTLV